MLTHSSASDNATMSVSHHVSVSVSVSEEHLLPQQNTDGQPLWEERSSAHRVRYLVVHCLDAHNAAEAKDMLSRHAVSAHYCVDPEGELFCFVHPSRVAYHAGESRFDSDEHTPLYVKPGIASNVRTLNYTSIGIEFLCPGYAKGGRDWFHFAPFTAAQRTAGVRLIAHLVARWDIDTDNILAHSDVAPFRCTPNSEEVVFAKSDPGPLFFWEALRERGLSLPLPCSPSFVAETNDDNENNRRTDSMSGCESDVDRATVLWAQESLRIIGYCGTPLSAELDLRTACVLVAFELHFVPAKFNDPSYAREALNTLDKRRILTRDTLHALKELREYKLKKKNNALIK